MTTTEEVDRPVDDLPTASPAPEPADGPDVIGSVAASAAPPGAPEPGPVRRLVRSSVVVVTALAFVVALEVVAVSGIQHRAAQVRSFATFRGGLAKGTLPIAEAGSTTSAIRIGTPVALLEVPSLHIREVVAEGTTSGSLMSGPGHQRGTPLPGQAGTSVILGRRAAYGGPFRSLGDLKPGATIKVTTGQGVSTYKVIRPPIGAGAKTAPVAAGAGRLQLVTAGGGRFMPAGVVRAEADLVGTALPAPTLAASVLPAAERPLGVDTSTLWVLVLWLQALICISIAAVWSWLRWGRIQTWIVFVPLTLLVGLAATGQLLRVLPNLL